MGRILVIDDYPGVRQMMEYYLPHFGHTVASAADGPTGLRLAGEEVFDLVLVDLDMPRMSGLDVCRKLKSDPHRQALPVILITGRVTIHVMIQAKSAGIAEVIAKPFEWNDLSDAITRFIPTSLQA